ncbi:hypothetical protein [Mesorhizobium sp.]|uniref:hypothetical protein n=1 Tax=Mesorhizobium sp. TaxID=1871066 RepID=UPI001210E1E1|nr:MAG: hypothetical protein E5X73_22115 [Mesorhizobium sp.]
MIAWKIVGRKRQMRMRRSRVSTITLNRSGFIKRPAALAIDSRLRGCDLVKIKIGSLFWVAFLQRYTCRGSKSTWTQINVDNVAWLIAEGRMTEHGLAQLNAAKADGRQARAHSAARL